MEGGGGKEGNGDKDSYKSVSIVLSSKSRA